jgi:cell division septum initiation protein DivIVA
MKKQTTPEVSGFEKKVDTLKGIVSEIEDLKSRASVLEDELKQEGASRISSFGSLNFLGSDAIAQIQKRRPSISSTKVDELQSVLGDKFGLLFDVETDGSWTLKQDRVSELQTIISKAGWNLRK